MPIGRGLMSSEFQVTNLWGNKSNPCSSQKAWKTPKRKRKEKTSLSPTPTLRQSLLFCILFAQWKSCCTQRHITDSQMEGDGRREIWWYMTSTAGWFHCFSNKKKISLLRSLNMNFKDIQNHSDSLGRKLAILLFHACLRLQAEEEESFVQ